MKVLVCGATGYVGGRLVTRLLADGHEVVCLARDPAHLERRGWERVTVAQGDALDAATLPAAMAGVEALYYLIHSMSAGEKGFAARDRTAAENVGRAAREAGVRRIVYLGGLGKVDEHLSAHLASRHEVGDVLRASGVPVTEFRAAVIVGSGSVSFEIIRYLAEGLPIILTPRWMSTSCQPISITNVVEYLALALGEPRSIGRTLEIGGPDVLSYADMLRGYAKVRRLRRFIFPVPVLTPRLSALGVHLLTPIPVSIAHPLILGLRNEVVVHDHTAEELFKVQLIPYEEAVERALLRIQSDTVETYWAGARSGLAPGVTLEVTEGMILERRRVETCAPPAAVFAVFTSIGGERGWFYGDWGWRLRGQMDRLVGGVGMRRGRRSPTEVRPGEALDFWRVEAVEQDRLMRLRAEMKVPGLAWLQFESQPTASGGTLLVQTAFFEPRGFFGLLYWYVLYPIHQLFFSGMAREITRRAELQAAVTAAR